MLACRNMHILQKHILRVYTGQRSPLRKWIDQAIYNYCNTSTGKFKDSDRFFGIPEGNMECCDINNGIRLISEYKESFITTIGCVVPAGAAFEKPEERGSALFLEHTLFQKTIERKQQHIEKELQEIGATLVANAMRDVFVFYGTAPSCNAERLTELIIDVAVNNDICDNHVEAAKFRILKELSKIDSDPKQMVMEYVPNIAYQDTVLSKSVFPESHTIKDFETEYLISFKNRVFKPCFMTMISSGAITLRELERIVCKYVTEETENVQSSEAECQLKSFQGLKQLRFTGAELRLRDDDEELGYVAIGFEGPNFSQYLDRYALEVAKEIVGSWNMSYAGANHNAPYLAHSAFNTNMCHLYESFILDWAYNSIWGCYFICDKLKLDDMVSMLLNEWQRLYTTITNMEVSRAVNNCKVHELRKLNDPVARFFDIVNCLYLRNCYEPMEQRLLTYEKITANTIREATAKYICDQSPTVVGFGRIENLTDYLVICHGTYSYYY